MEENRQTFNFCPSDSLSHEDLGTPSYVYIETHAACCFPMSSRRSGGAKPSMCTMSSLSSLFKHISVNARIEAVLYLCKWLKLACSSSVFLVERAHIGQDDGQQRSLT